MLVARGEADLRTICGELTGRGARVTYAVADVGDKAQVRAAADHAIETFGGFETWVNVAGLTIYGPLKDVSQQDNERLMRTNVWGTVAMASVYPSSDGRLPIKRRATANSRPPHLSLRYQEREAIRFRLSFRWRQAFQPARDER